jgi:hypothetical protein
LAKEPWLRVRLDGVHRAFWLAHPAIDALVRMNDEHILALVETVHGANLDTVCVLATNAALVDDVSHWWSLHLKASRSVAEKIQKQDFETVITAAFMSTRPSKRVPRC